MNFMSCLEYPGCTHVGSDLVGSASVISGRKGRWLDAAIVNNVYGNV